MNIVLKPIGYVRTHTTDEELRNILDRSNIRGYIEILPEYTPGLKGLEDFSHIIIIAYLHKVPENAKNTLIIKPRRLLKFGFKPDELPEIGVFASDSPHRPNPIALTIVELEKIEENKLHVKGLDLYNETPVLDIKPYNHKRQIENIKIPEWLKQLEEKIKEKTGLNITP